MRLKFSSNTPCLGYFTHPLSRKPQKSELILQTLHLNPSHIRPLTSQLCSQSSHHTPHNAQLTSHTSHLSPPPYASPRPTSHLVPHTALIRSRNSQRTHHICHLTARSSHSHLTPHTSHFRHQIITQTTLETPQTSSLTPNCRNFK